MHNIEICNDKIVTVRSLVTLLTTKQIYKVQGHVRVLEHPDSENVAPDYSDVKLIWRDR